MINSSRVDASKVKPADFLCRVKLCPVLCCVLTLALEWYVRVPLEDRVTYFFFHSLFRELPLLFHRMLCRKQARSTTQNLFRAKRVLQQCSDVS